MVTTAVALADMGPSPPASPHVESDGPQNRFQVHIGPHGHGRRRGHHHHHQHHHSRGGPRGHCHHHHHHGAGPHPPPPPHFLGDALHFGPAQFGGGGGGGGGLHRGRRGSRGLHHAPLHGPHHGPHLGPHRIICRPESHAFSHLGGFKGHHRGRRMHRSLSPRHLRPHSPPGDHPHHHHRGHLPPPPPPPPPFDHDGSALDFAAHSADSPAPPPEIQRGIEQLRQLCLNY